LKKGKSVGGQRKKPLKKPTKLHAGGKAREKTPLTPKRANVEEKEGKICI